MPLAARWLYLAPGGSERAAEVAARELAKGVVPPIIQFLDTKYEPLFQTVQSLAGTVNGLPAIAKQIEIDLGTRLERQLHYGLKQANGQLTAYRVDTAKLLTEQSALIRGDLRPPSKALETLLTNYAALPTQLGDELRPVWKGTGNNTPGLESELTCLRPDGSGYGSCYKGRVHALLGEAVKVGGVFTQKFPQIADSTVKTGDAIAGITDDVHAWTDKNVRPRPMTKKEKAMFVLKILVAGGMAYLTHGI